MRQDAALPDSMPAGRSHTLLRLVAEAALLAGLFVAMAVCLAAGPLIASLLLK